MNYEYISSVLENGVHVDFVLLYWLDDTFVQAVNDPLQSDVLDLFVDFHQFYNLLGFLRGQQSRFQFW